MGSKTWEELWRISRIILGVWIVNGFLIIYLITQIDNMVNVQLYNFGLQYSSLWADPYWINSRLIMALLGVSMALSVVVFLAGFRKPKEKAESPQVTLEEETQATLEKNLPVVSEKKSLAVLEESQVDISKAESEPVTGLEPEIVNEPQPEVIQREHVSFEEKNSEVEDEQRVNVDVGEVISCPYCGRVFKRPLVKMDFSSGTTCLVNICPFCNHPLGAPVGSKNEGKIQE
jgi:uncharacterized Zn-finger protein